MTDCGSIVLMCVGTFTMQYYPVRTGLQHQTSEQHIELGTSRIKRDNSNLIKVQNWFEKHDPFDQSEPNLKSLSPGVIASTESGINCDKTEKVGEEIQNLMMGRLCKMQV